MAENIEIRLIIDAPLVKFFEEGMHRRHIDVSPCEELTDFLAMILNDTMYPLASNKTGENEIHLTYRPRAFADPIF